MGVDPKSAETLSNDPGYRVGSVKTAREGQDIFVFDDGTDKNGIWGVKEQIEAEWKMLATFFESADLSGLPLPEDSQHLRQLLVVLY